MVDETHVEAEPVAEKVKAVEEPTKEEIEFVARIMDSKGELDFDGRPERCENARVAARAAIIGYRACQRLSEAPKAKEPAKPAA